MLPARAFTTSANGLLKALVNRCGISPAWDPQSGQPAPRVEAFEAIWDTGATNSVITQKVIDRCGLAPTGMAQVRGVHGTSQSETYLVNVALPHNVVFTSVRVTKGDFTGGDVLIGMDVIRQGDFAITNYGGVTKFSFRTPPQGHIDFVQEIDAASAARAQPANRAERRRAKKAADKSNR